MSLTPSQIMPIYAQRLLLIGPVPVAMRRITDNAPVKVWAIEGDHPQLDKELVMDGVDCIVFYLTDWDVERLKVLLFELHGILNPEGRLSFVASDNIATQCEHPQWKKLIAGFQFKNYQTGKLTTSKPELFGFTVVRKHYDPLMHAYRLATQGRPDWAKVLLKDMPGDCRVDERIYLQVINYIDDAERNCFSAKHALQKPPMGSSSGILKPVWNRLENSGPEDSIHENVLSRVDSPYDVHSIHLGLVKGENYGWGVCSRYLIEELSKVRSVHVISSDDGSDQNTNLPGVLFQALNNIDFDPMFPGARAQYNIGYTFFENELTERSIQNAKQLDFVLGGSSYCRDRMMEKGISNCGVLIQGIDPTIFYPIEEHTGSDRFVIFSGGKFELRKGQDLVLRAVKIMQEKYPDVWLVNCWYNLWPNSTRLMGYSQHIRFEYNENESWANTMYRTYIENGLDPDRIITQELVPQTQQRDLYALTDVGLFPNRCEGGTNLVLMEYMACAKPVIASYNTGHTDIINDQNALLLKQQSPYNIVDAKGKLIARWHESSLDEIVGCLEYAYHHRNRLKSLATQAGGDLKSFTWAHSASRLLSFLDG